MLDLIVGGLGRRADHPMLRINGLQVLYDDVILALNGVSLEVPEGAIVALLGANGAGKSTTLKAVSGLLAPGAGRGHQGHDRARRRADRPPVARRDRAARRRPR